MQREDGQNIHTRSSQGSLPPDVEKQQQPDALPAPTKSNAHPYLLSRLPHLLPVNEVIHQLTTDQDNGLTEEQSATRIKQVGLNELEGGEGVSVLRILVGQIFNAMALVRLFRLFRLFFCERERVITKLAFTLGSNHGNGSFFRYPLLDRGVCRHRSRDCQHRRWLSPRI